MLLTFASVNTLSISGASRGGECSDGLAKAIKQLKEFDHKTVIRIEKDREDDKIDIVN